VVELRDGHISRWDLDPTDLGIRLADPADLVGGDPEQNAVILRGVLSGEDRGARRDIVVLNAAAGLVVAGVSEDLVSGLEAAGESIDSGAATRVLQSISD
jgi:anthranilate phosphoribosyltransferase